MTYFKNQLYLILPIPCEMKKKGCILCVCVDRWGSVPALQLLAAPDPLEVAAACGPIQGLPLVIN